MKNESRKKSKNITCPCDSRAEIIWQTIQLDLPFCTSLMSAYTKDKVQKNEILSNVVSNMMNLTIQKFDNIENLRMYIRRVVRNESIAYSEKRAKLNEDNLDDLSMKTEKTLLSEDLHEVQRGEMTDIFIDYYRQIKVMLGEKDFDLLHRWGILEHSYAQMMTDLGLTEPQVRMKIAHLREKIKPKFKKFWR